MKRHALAFVLVLATAVGYGQTGPERQVISDAAEALGGAAVIQRSGVITMEGVGIANGMARPARRRRGPGESCRPVRSGP